MHTSRHTPPVECLAIPDEASVFGMAGDVQLADAFAVALPAGAVHDPTVLARWMFEHPPGWISQLLAVRNALVMPFGLKTSTELRRAPAQERVAMFKIHFVDSQEILMGQDDSHLDFRVSVLVQAGEAGACVVVSTVVHCHNRLGRFYIAVVAPFHRVIVKSLLRRAAKNGWPQTRLAAA